MNYTETKRVRHRGRVGGRLRKRKAASESKQERETERFSMTVFLKHSTHRHRPYQTSTSYPVCKIHKKR